MPNKQHRQEQTLAWEYKLTEEYVCICHGYLLSSFFFPVDHSGDGCFCFPSTSHLQNRFYFSLPSVRCARLARICFLLMVLYCLFSSEIVLLRLPAIFQCAHLLRNHNDQNDDECLVYLYSTFWWHTFLSFQYQLGEFDGYASSFFNFKPFHFIQSTNCAVLFIWLTTKSVEIIFFLLNFRCIFCFQMFLYARICYCDFITWIKWKCKNFHDNLNITIIMRRFELFINFNIKYIYFFLSKLIVVYECYGEDLSLNNVKDSK